MASTHDGISLAGQVAIVTGARHGLGRAHALLLARLGAAVVVNDLHRDDGEPSSAADVVAEIEAAGGLAVASYESVASSQGGRAIVGLALQRYGTIDIVVNNAGVLRNANFEDLTVDQIDAVIDVHLKGAFHVTQPAFEVMRDKGYGRIVLTSSSSGAFGMGGLANYAAAKAGLIGLGRALAVEGAEFGILANCILPYGNAPWRGAAVHASRGVGVFGDVALLRPSMEPETVSPLVAYLASPECAATGEVFSALAGRFSRVFTALAPGWLANDPYAVTVDDIRTNLEQIRSEAGYTVPASIGDEMGAVADLLRPRG